MARVVYRTQGVARTAGDLSRIRRRRETITPRNPTKKKERMLRTSSIFGPLQSGFVPFASGAPIDAVVEAETETAEIIARVSTPTVETFAPPVEAPESIGLATSPAWAPASAARIRVVEALVVAGVCGYFAFGLLSTVFGR